MTRMAKIQTSNLRLHHLAADSQDNKRDQRDAGYTVCLKAIRAWPNGVTGIVARAVGDDAWISRIIFFDLENDLHQIGTISAIFVKIPPATRSAAARGFADGEPYEARAGIIMRNKKENE